MKTGLVLSGGSIRGAFQAGALSATLQSGVVPDSIYGVSIGALNGAFVADRAGRAVRERNKPDWPQIGLELENFWLDRVSSFELIGRKRSDPALIWDAVFNNFKSLIDMSKMDDMVRSEIKAENLRACPAQFYAGVVNVADGGYEDVSVDSPNIIDYVLASTRIPIVMPIEEIADKPLVDGGLRNVAPLKSSIKSGAERIIAIVNQGRNFSEVALNTRSLLSLAFRYMDIAVSEIVRNDVEWAEHINQFCPQDGSIVEDGPFAGYRYIPVDVIRPENEPALNLETFTRADIEDLVSVGKAVAEEVLGQASHLQHN